MESYSTDSILIVADISTTLRSSRFCSRHLSTPKRKSPLMCRSCTSSTTMTSYMERSGFDWNCLSRRPDVKGKRSYELHALDASRQYTSLQNLGLKILLVRQKKRTENSVKNISNVVSTSIQSCANWLATVSLCYEMSSLIYSALLE